MSDLTTRFANGNQNTYQKGATVQHGNPSTDRLLSRQNSGPGSASLVDNGDTTGSTKNNNTSPPRPSKDTAQAKSTYYRYWLPFQTKWHENDMYDHLNNAVYVTYFDAIINEFLITRCKMVPSSQDAPIGLVVSSSFSYNAPLEFPAPLLAGLSVTKLGKSSVTYGIALFAAKRLSRTGDAQTGIFDSKLQMISETAAAYGEMTHVFVDPHTRRPVEMPAVMRQELSKLQ
ncbi:Thioesterase/thiol ester dehydrase-isomerase [Cystobasidium minutum MCA 4210]|uniref:Thioesterase/thiol ester dehydrase-isomerase n=1 Tax=Cystobasidium minutum MCA 4210 TaxID=1397322 RepID=UPI0034CDECFD|eukprot:jgi/Rhomi1/145588/e_gw1.5.244.1